MLRAIAIASTLLVSIGCAGESTECTPENHCRLDADGAAGCEPGYTWVDPYAQDDFRCTPGSNPVCEPLTCAEANAECGSGPDGCGGLLDCGQCPGGHVCGENYRCRQQECVPATCIELGVECGAAPDGCGVTLQCGSCPSGSECRSGACRPEGCTSHVDSVCVEGDLVWRDSCGQLEDLRQDCGDWGCDGGRCLTWMDLWTCSAAYYDAADGCDCACGTPDPDCELSGQTVYNCEPGQSCSAEGECVDPPCEHLCAGGDSSCQYGSLRTCTIDENDCRVWGAPQACATGTCADSSHCSTCSHECEPLGAQSCANGAVRTCVSGGDGCYDWSTPVACGSGFCADDSSCGACANTCSAGETLCADGVLQSCTADANGCLAFGAPESCVDGFCADAQTCGVCDHGCLTVGAVRCLDGEIDTCTADANGCRAWVFTSSCTSGACAGGATCLTCETSCAAPTSCAGSTLNSCGLNANGCRSTITSTCALGCATDQCNRCDEHLTVPLGRSDTSDGLDASIWDFELVGDIAYAVQGEHGLAIIDTGDWNAMTTVGRLAFDGKAVALAVRDNTIFVVQQYPHALIAVDASNDFAPVELGRLTDLHSPQGLALSGDLVLVADYGGPDGGLKVIDASDPSNLTQVGHRITSGYARTLDTVGTHAYVACEDGGLEVIDFSTPTAPSWAFNLAGADTNAVTAGGGYAYVAVGSQLRVLDVADPAAPVQVASVNPDMSTYYSTELDLVGSVLFASDAERAVHIDVSAPAAPVVGGYLQSSPADGSLTALEPAGAEVMVSFSSRELVVFPVDWTRHQSVYVSEDPYLHAREGNILVLGSDDSLTLYDASDATDPRALSTISTGWSRDMTAVDIQGHLMAVGADNYRSYDPDTTYVDIYDISNPRAPTMVSSVYLGAHNAVSSVMVRGDLLYATEGYGGFTVIDIATPSQAAVLGNLDYYNGPMVHDDAYAYVADGGTVEIIELLHPTHPLLAGQESFGENINAIAYQAGRLVLAGEAKRLAVYDTTAAPVLSLLWEKTLSIEPERLELFGEYLLVGAYREAFVIDMNDPAHAEHLTTYAPARVRGVDVVDNQMQVFFQNGYLVRDVCSP